MRARTSADLSIGDINLFIFRGPEGSEGEHALLSLHGTRNEMKNTSVERQSDEVSKTY